jgi:hypothetical protein
MRYLICWLIEKGIFLITDLHVFLLKNVPGTHSLHIIYLYRKRFFHILEFKVHKCISKPLRDTLHCSFFVSDYPNNRTESINFCCIFFNVCFIGLKL